MKILLIDDHELFSKSIKMVLEQEEQIEKVELLTDLQRIDFDFIEAFDIILLDINLSTLYDSDGLELAKLILKHNPNSKVVILTGYNREMYEYQAFKLGACAFLDKSIEPDYLVEVLIKVNRGKRYFKVINQIDLLTKRELEILSEVRHGLTIEELCSKFNISNRTVSNHLGKVFEKLDATNRQEAILKAESLGYFSPE